MSDSPPAPQFSRRTIIQASAWSIPAIAAVTATPAYAATTGQVAITSVPQSTASCRSTTEPLTAQLSGGTSTVGQLVQFQLPSGWSWRQGSGSYVSDSNGVATVPAGDITAGVASGTVTATWGGATGAASLPLVITGALRTTENNQQPGPPSSANWIRLSAVDTAVVATIVTGEVWTTPTLGGKWQKVAGGASTGPQQATCIAASSRRGTWWIQNGTLMLDSAADSFPVQGDVVRVYSLRGTGAIARANGDIWKWDSSNGFTQVGSGGATGPSQLAVWSAGTQVAWIKSGVIYIDGAPATFPNNANTGFVRVYSSEGGLAAVTTDGAIWSRSSSRDWTLVGSGAATGPFQAGYASSAGNLQCHWLQDGKIMASSSAVAFRAPDKNENFQSLVVSERSAGVIAVKSSGDVWTWINGRWSTGSQGAFRGSTGPGQTAVREGSVDGNNGSYWIQPRTNCYGS